jgi:hypothetical protein
MAGIKITGEKESYAHDQFFLVCWCSPCLDPERISTKGGQCQRVKPVRDEVYQTGMDKVESDDKQD